MGELAKQRCLELFSNMTPFLQKGDTEGIAEEEGRVQMRLGRRKGRKSREMCHRLPGPRWLRRGRRACSGWCVIFGGNSCTASAGHAPRGPASASRGAGGHQAPSHPPPHGAGVRTLTDVPGPRPDRQGPGRAAVLRGTHPVPHPTPAAAATYTRKIKPKG